MEILLPRMKYTYEIAGTHEGALLPERAPGACSGNKIPLVYRPLKRWRNLGETKYLGAGLGFGLKIRGGHPPPPPRHRSPLLHRLPVWHNMH